jgi:ATP-binding cassette subfamily F protein uup
VTLRGGLRVGFLPQQPRLEDTLTILDSVSRRTRDFRQLRRSCRYRAVTKPPPGAEHQRLLNDLNARDAWKGRGARSQKSLAARAQTENPLSSHAVWWRATPRGPGPVLMDTPDLLILDEPTKPPGLRGHEWMQEMLAAYAARWCSSARPLFSDAVATRVMVIGEGRIRFFRG